MTISCSDIARHLFITRDTILLIWEAQGCTQKNYTINIIKHIVMCE
jgi:hypothetical protein